MFQKIEIINPFFAIEGFGFVIEIIFFFNSDSIPIFVDSHTLLNSFFKSSKNSTCDVIPRASIQTKRNHVSFLEGKKVDEGYCGWVKAKRKRIRIGKTCRFEIEKNNARGFVWRVHRLT